MSCAAYAAVTAPRGASQPAALAAERTRIERVIGTGRADAATWLEYAVLLRAAGQPGDAADACAAALAREPYNRGAMFERALALAENGAADALKKYLAELVVSDAKLAVDVFGTTAVSPFLRDAAFRRLLDDAHSQALD